MKKAKPKKKIEYEIGSGNVFADLGLSDANELFAKSQMAMGIDQPSVSRLLNGSLRGFSVERLMEFLSRLLRFTPSC
jgi:predicted XRE-type DNA-binding protein